MIGLVFGFAWAVFLLFVVIGLIALVIEEPELLWIPVIIIVVWYSLSQ